MELHIIKSHHGIILGMDPGNSFVRQPQASSCTLKNMHFILGIKEYFFILEVDIAVDVTLEKKSFEILMFSVRKIVIVLVGMNRRKKISWALLKQTLTYQQLCV